MKIHFGERFDSEVWKDKDLRGHTFVQCSFRHLTITPEQSLYGVTMQGCDLSFLEATGAEFDHFTAQDCTFAHANLKGAKFYQTVLLKCDFTWATFEGVHLRLCSGKDNNFQISRIQKAASINPYDRDMVSELIRVEANGDVEVLMAAALIKASMDFCWDDWQTQVEMPKWKRVGDILKRITAKYQSILNVSKTIINHGE